MPSTSYRLPEALNDRMVAAAEEEGSFRSELTRRAIRFYISENPDGIRAFAPKSARGGGDTSTDQGAGQEGGKDGGSEAESQDPMAGATYDPTLE